MTSPEPPPQPVPGEPYQTVPLTASAVEQGVTAYQALVVAPWLETVRDAVFPAGGPLEPYGVLSGMAYWWRGIRDFTRQTLWPFLRQPWESLMGVYFDSADPWTVNYSNTVANLLSHTPWMVYSKIREMVQQGVTDGIAPRVVAGQVDATFLDSGSPWWETRGVTVARTEMRRAQMGGLWHAYSDLSERSGQQFVKEWLDSDDNRVREAHVDTDGQRQPLSVPFLVGLRRGPKFPAMFPLDPSLPAELSIQCRCDVLIEEAGRRTDMSDRRFVSRGAVLL